MSVQVCSTPDIRRWSWEHHGGNPDALLFRVATGYWWKSRLLGNSSGFWSMREPLFQQCGAKDRHLMELLGPHLMCLLRYTRSFLKLLSARSTLFRILVSLRLTSSHPMCPILITMAMRKLLTTGSVRFYGFKPETRWILL